MITTRPAGGNFKAPATAGNYNHGHAAAMAHAAHQRMQVARLLGARAADQQPAPAAPPPVAAPPPNMNFKAHVAHAAAQQGVHATLPDVHQGIDDMVATGQLQPHQGAALKQHNGPLIGAPGQQTVGRIAAAVVARKRGMR